MAIFTALTAAKVMGKAKGIIRSPWFWAALIVVALGTGTFFYLRADKKDAVAAVTVTADRAATTKSLEADTAVTARVAERERPLIILREQTIKDYANARATIQAAPADDRTLPAPRLIVDTLNNLDRMRATRDPNPVPDAEVPVG